MKNISGRERRRLERFSIKAFALVQTLSTGAQKSFELYTQDVSSGGAFFPMEVPLPTGEKVKITLYLSIPVLESLHDVPNATRIATNGQVIRSDRRGLAVEFEGRYSMTSATA